MNTFELDLKRAIFSKGFILGLILEIIIIDKIGYGSGFYQLLMPTAVAFPYATAWLVDYNSGFIKLYLCRTDIKSYIFGKFWVSAISGGIMLVLSIYIAQWMNDKEIISSVVPIFAVGCLWAAISTTFSALTNSRYVAYGCGFVIYYLLILLYERYFPNIYYICPEHWIKYEDLWVFDEYGVLIMLAGIILILYCIFYIAVRRCIERD